MRTTQRTAPSAKPDIPDVKREQSAASDIIGQIDLDAGMQPGSWDAVSGAIPDANFQELTWEFKVPIERMTPKPRPGYVQQWIRIQSADGRPDVANKSEALQRGWRPRRQSTCSGNEMTIPVYDPGDGKGGVYVFSGQLLLCEMPIELWERHQKVFRAEQSRVMDAIYRQPTQETSFNPKYGGVRFEDPRESSTLVD